MCVRGREREGKTRERYIIDKTERRKRHFHHGGYVIGFRHIVTLAIILKHTGMNLDILKIYNLEQ